MVPALCVFCRKLRRLWTECWAVSGMSPRSVRAMEARGTAQARAGEKRLSRCIVLCCRHLFLQRVSQDFGARHGLCAGLRRRYRSHQQRAASAHFQNRGFGRAKPAVRRQSQRTHSRQTPRKLLYRRTAKLHVCACAAPLFRSASLGMPALTAVVCDVMCCDMMGRSVRRRVGTT